MSVLFLMVPAALALAAVAITAFVWAARNGQFDEVDTPPVRMLLEDQPSDSSLRHTAFSCSNDKPPKRGAT